MLFHKPLAGIILILALVLTQGCIVTRGTVGEPLQEQRHIGHQERHNDHGRSRFIDRCPGSDCPRQRS